MRVHALAPTRGIWQRSAWPGLAAITLGIGVGAGLWLQGDHGGTQSGPSTEIRADSDAAPPTEQTRTEQISPPAPRSALAPIATPVADADEDFSQRSQDPDDIAAYIRLTDPEPTMGELIEALNEAGIHEGIAAFNPPGTSPPLAGLAVPDDFVLPEGYVRHHQVTDEGVPLEPILMYSPDFEFLDEAGQPVEVPANRVVPAELAPPGMPIHPLDPPP